MIGTQHISDEDWSMICDFDDTNLSLSYDPFNLELTVTEDSNERNIRDAYCDRVLPIATHPYEEEFSPGEGEYDDSWLFTMKFQFDRNNIMDMLRCFRTQTLLLQKLANLDKLKQSCNLRYTASEKPSDSLEVEGSGTSENADQYSRKPDSEGEQS